MKAQINQLKTQFATELSAVQTQPDLDGLYLKYLGKKGSTTILLKTHQGLALKDKKI